MKSDSDEATKRRSDEGSALRVLSLRRSVAPSPRRAYAFTLIEMLTTVAVLIIVLGLMVSLAREVRFRSAEQLTKELLRNLDEAARSFRQRTGALPDVPAIIAPDDLHPSEVRVRAAAQANNARLVQLLRSEIERSGLLEQEKNNSQNTPETRERGGFSDLPISLYDGRVLADAWGNPIVFMANPHPAIGMAPVKQGEEEHPFFFFSAGPDGQYLTRADNLYSYEQGR